MARKRELRAMLEKQDEGYEDDAFEGTPFRNRKSVLKVIVVAFLSGALLLCSYKLCKHCTLNDV